MRSPVLCALCAAAVTLAACGDDDAGPSAVCGNGAKEAQEQCDDGNTESGDGCSSCKQEQGWNCESSPCVAICGDGKKVGGEVCDPGATPAYCSEDCSTVTGSCGDGKVQQEVESCDPGTGTLKGCKSCDPAFGYSCDKAQNTCKASGLPSDKKMPDLTKDETRKYCEWLIGAVGGAGEVWTCSTYQFTNFNVDTCVSKVFGNWGVLAPCTVGQIEEYTASFSDRCGFMLGGDPPCGK